MSAQNTPLSSSSGVIDGDLWVDAGLEDFMDNYGVYLGIALEKATVEETDNLKRAALTMDEWDAIADDVVVAYSDGAIQFGIHQRSSEEADRLEFGGEETPRPLFRREVLRAVPRLEKALVVEVF